MKPKTLSHWGLSTLLLFAATFSLPGCQTSKFPLPSLPGMSIWSGDKMDLTPRKLDTPSSQFHPEFAGENETPSPTDKGDVQQKVDDLIRSAENEKQQAEQGQPLRQPYSLESLDPKVSLPATRQESNNGFQPVNTSQPNASSDNGFSLPGSQFQNLQNTLNQLPSEPAPPTNPTQPVSKNSIPGWDSDFTPSEKRPAQPNANRNPTNGFQPIPTQLATPPSAAPANRATTFPTNTGNGFAPPAMPKLNQAPAPHNLLQPAAPTTQNQLQAAPQATIQLPLSPMPKTNDQATSVPDGGTSNIGGVKLPGTSSEGDKNRTPVDNSFGPLPFPLPEPAAQPADESTTDIVPVPGMFQPPPLVHDRTPSRGTELPITLEAHPVSPSPEAKTSGGLPAALQTGSGGFAPGSIKQLKQADQN